MHLKMARRKDLPGQDVWLSLRKDSPVRLTPLDLPMRMNAVLCFRSGFRDVWPTHLSTPALYPVSVRNLAALTKMRLTTTFNCQLHGAFAGFLPTVRYLTAVAFV